MLSKFGKDKREEIYPSFHDGRVLSRRRVNATNDLFKATKAKDSLPDHDIGTESGFSEDYRKYADMAISQLSPGSQDRFRRYIKLVSLGLVVRGYNIKELKPVNCDKFDLHPLDSPKLFQIRQDFRHGRQYAGLRAFVAGDIPLRKVKDFAAAGGGFSQQRERIPEHDGAGTEIHLAEG
ncbi:hypothetical protein LY76DRAFT_646254 [Colletotrichum caudatum]|nr:hypothetical protein LY76DRAFT_646254 [Colletotrichum caudatum]